MRELFVAYLEEEVLVEPDKINKQTQMPKDIKNNITFFSYVYLIRFRTPDPLPVNQAFPVLIGIIKMSRFFILGAKKSGKNQP